MENIFLFFLFEVLIMFNTLYNSLFVAFLLWIFSQIEGTNELKLALFEFK